MGGFWEKLPEASFMSTEPVTEASKTDLMLANQSIRDSGVHLFKWRREKKGKDALTELIKQSN